jgi:hypothetical protein
MRREQATDLDYAELAIELVAPERTSDPQVQQDLLAKTKESGVIDSLAKCVVFAAWADQHSGETSSTKEAAWYTLFPRWSNTSEKTSLAERRTLLKAMGAHDYKQYIGTPPSETQVGDVSL